MKQSDQLSAFATGQDPHDRSWYRSLCILLSVVLVLALIPTTAVAASKDTTTVPSQKASTPPLGSGEDTYGAPANAKPDPASKVVPQKNDPNAKRVKEIVEDRTVNTKTYELSDGERQIVDSAGALHYKNAKGQFVDISENLVSSEATAPVGSIETLSTENKTSFSSTAQGAATLTSPDGKQSVSFTYCGQELSAPLSLGDTALYLDPTGATTLQYQALSNGVKETLLLNTPTTKTSYDFRLDFTGLSLKQDKGTWELIKEDGSVAYVLSDLVVSDSAEQEVACPNISWELLSSGKSSARFRATIDKSWLASSERVWPVKIDPSATISVAQDGYVSSGTPTTNYNTATTLQAGYNGTASGYNRSYIKFNALPSLAGASIDSVTFSAYVTAHQERDFSNGAVTAILAGATTTSYLAQASAAIPSTVTWNTKPAMSASIATASIASNSTWATYTITSALTGPLTTGAAFNGLVLYQSESATTSAMWNTFSSSEGAHAPYMTITYSTKTAPITNLTYTQAASAKYFKETDVNKDGIADNKNDYPDAGRGSVDLSWNADPHAAGYHVYMFDGGSYRQVGTTLGQNNTTWSSAGAGIYPSDSTISKIADSSSTANPFVGQGPSPALKTGTAILAYPAGTTYSANGGNGTGIVVADGNYLYVKQWGTYPGASKWVRFTQTNAATASVPTYGSGEMLATADSVPISHSAFMLNGVLYDGSVLSATTNTTTIAGYAASAFDNASAHRLSFTFDQSLLTCTTGVPVASGYSGADVMLATDGTYIYSAGISGQGFAVRQYDDTGHFIKAWSVSVSGTTPFSYFDSMTCDGNNLYLLEWTANGNARTYKVSLTTHQVTDVWGQTDQGATRMVTLAYDSAHKRFIGGALDTSTSLYIFRGSGLDLRDNPAPLYQKSTTTTYYGRTHYWFRITPYDTYGESSVSSAIYVMPTLENRTIAAANAPDVAYTSLGSMQGLNIEAAEGRPDVRIQVPGLSAATYGPAAQVSCTYTSDMASTSDYLPKDWRFSFEQTITQLSSGAVQYTDGDGIQYLFAQDPQDANAYDSPAGMFSVLAKTSSGWTMTDPDQTQHTFGSDGKISADIDRNGNQTTYSYPSGGVKIQAANGHYLQLSPNSTNGYTLSLNAGSNCLNEFSYTMSSATGLEIEENVGDPVRVIYDDFSMNTFGQVTEIDRTAQSTGSGPSATLAYTANSVGCDYAADGASASNSQVMYSLRSANVTQATLVRGPSATNNNAAFPPATEKQVFLTDPSGQELWSSTSADQAYGTYCTYNAYNQVITTRDPVAPSADGLSYTDCPESAGTPASTLSDYDSSGNLTYSLDKAGLETWNYYNDTNDLIKTIDNNRGVTWNDVDDKGNILVSEKLIAASGERSRTEYTYNSQGLTTSEKDAISQNSDGTYIFDEKDFSNFADNGDPQQTIERNVQLAQDAALQDITTSCVIDNFGNTLSTTDGRGIVTNTSTYDVADSVLTSTDKTGMTTTDTYDAFGNKLEEYQSPAGSSTKYNWVKNIYDYKGNVLTTSNLDTSGNAVQTTTKGYDCLSREVISDDSSQAGAQKTSYDAAGNVVTQTSEGTEAGTTTTNTYDAAGQQVSSVNSLTTGAPTTTTYDAAGNVTSTKTTGQPDQGADYDIAGNAVTQTTGGVTDTCDYDLDGNVTSDTQTASGKPTVTTTSAYDLKGELLSTKMGAQTATTNTYNVRGDLLATTDFDGITTTYSYDADGNQLTEKVGSDDPTTKTYDSASRVTKQVNPDGTEADYAYDSLGRVSEQKDLKGSTTLKDTTTTYDSAGRVSSIDESVSGYKQAFNYQNTGSGTTAQTVTTKTETYADGSTQTSTVNGALFGSDTLSPKSGSSYNVANTSYDAGGRPTARTVGSQSSTLSYDSQGRLVTDTDLSAAGQATYSYASDDSKLTSSSYSRLGSQSAAYTYSPDRTQLASAKIGSTTTAYAYNATTGDITSAGATSYSYDSTGKLSGRASSGGLTVSLPIKTSFAYDELGRRTSNDQGLHFGWSGQRLTSSTNVEMVGSKPSVYAYDASGQRLSKTVSGTTTDYLYDGTKLVSLTAKSPSLTQNITYLYGSGSTPVAACYSTPSTSTATPAVNFEIVSDQRGDVRELRDTNGVAFARYDYDAYGNITSDQEFATSLITLALAQQISAIQPLRYAGYVFDAETGYYYCSQRYYDPTTASFISRDPAKADGEKSPYMYCAGEPVNSIDPSGLLNCCSSTKAIPNTGLTVNFVSRWEVQVPKKNQVNCRVFQVDGGRIYRGSSSYTVTYYRFSMYEFGTSTSGNTVYPSYYSGWYSFTNPKTNNWGGIPLVFAYTKAPYIKWNYGGKDGGGWQLISFSVDVKVKQSGKSAITVYRVTRTLWDDNTTYVGVMKM